jgi:membrane fusion protein (multidrug efflux system)
MGVVKEVLVDDNQVVQAGDVLVRLDPADNQAAYDEAKANFDKAQLDDQRDEELLRTKAIPQEDLDHAHSDLQAAQARLETARLQLDYTTIVAPASGRVGRKNVEVGNHVQPGETLLMIVEKEVWVVANFKETQLAKIRPQQAVGLTIDSIPGKTFSGFVDSLGPASGNEFALLPADNSTGNFTKIVQRIPVKIRFNPDSLGEYQDRIRPGMSVVAKVMINN